MNYKKYSKVFFIFICFLVVFMQTHQKSLASNNITSPKHPHSEASYQHSWCSVHNGIEEYENKDKTRVDCLTETHAVEFDFAKKWAESIGQALHYQLMTGKKAMVILILENPKTQMVYYKRVKRLAEVYNFDTEYVTPAILNIQDEKCIYLDCKCHSK